MGVDGHFLVWLVIDGGGVVVVGSVGCVKWEGVVFEAPSVEFACLCLI